MERKKIIKIIVIKVMTVIRKKGAKILTIVMELLEMTKIANQRIMMKVVMTKTKVAAMMKKKIAVKAVAMKKMRKRKKNMAVIPVKAMMGIINQGGKIRMIKKKKSSHKNGVNKVFDRNK